MKGEANVENSALIPTYFRIILVKVVFISAITIYA
jgi:hypothetical protein